MPEFYTNFFLRGNNVYVRGYKNGKRFSEVIDYKPYLFFKSGDEVVTKYHDLEGNPLIKVTYDNIKEAKKECDFHKDIINSIAYGSTSFDYVYIYERFRGNIEYSFSDINVISIDIETDSSHGFPDIEKADKEITAITLSRNGEKIVMGYFPYKPKSENIKYILCEDEQHLLKEFLQVWQSETFTPDIVTGWNIELFDIPYIYKRLLHVLGQNQAKKLSPWGIITERKEEIYGEERTLYFPQGINILDYYRLYRKFSFGNQESYALDHIAEIVLKENKLDYSEYGSLHNLYVGNFEKFIDYNIHDVTLVDRLEEKLGFIKQVIAFAYDAKVNYEDTYATVKPWDVIIHNYLMDRNIVIPPMTKQTMETELLGGFVKEPIPGMYHWIVSFDLNSLYPHLIMQYNISPETKIKRIKKFPSLEQLLDTSLEFNFNDQYSYAANGVVFQKDKQGFLPAIMQKMYNDRSEYKTKMLEAKKKLETLPETASSEERRLIENDISRYHNLQLAKKIQLNSAYGALGNLYFRWFNFDLAEAITMSGQLSIRWIEIKMNEYLNKLLKTNNKDYIIAADTDSIYVDMESLVNFSGISSDKIKIVEMLDKFCDTKIQKMINNSYQQLADRMCAYEQKMFMKRETIADKGIWTAKKRYILNAWNIEGVQFSEPELKVSGIEAVRSSTPKVCRESIKKLLKILMNKTEEDVQDFIKDFRENFYKMPFENVAFPRGIKGVKKYDNTTDRFDIITGSSQRNLDIVKGTPIHVRGALIYNEVIRNNKKLSEKYRLISDGDKIKFTYLLEPNPLMTHVISVVDTLPNELKLDQYIDYETQFNKTFLDPITKILDCVGWSVEKKFSFDQFIMR
jgi:DNA polymerase elongation subunit (family B)